MPQTGTLELDLDLPANAAPLAFHLSDWETAYKELPFPVTFDEPFSAAPLVMLGISALKTDTILRNAGDGAHPNLDLVILPRNITATGFNILLRIGRRNTTARINVSWLAIETATAGQTNP